MMSSSQKVCDVSPVFDVFSYYPLPGHIILIARAGFTVPQSHIKSISKNISKKNDKKYVFLSKISLHLYVFTIKNYKLKW